ncbi:NF-kappa-B-activating protein [Myotis brandtii]|uniref:NF-kappa-B-activating protein n=1 Tax=Myotis brandtii TaxID=109478 RepID=S7PKY8_MYOBR|nr:NF-kappa-B-activating protein [Myotis brandtii]
MGRILRDGGELSAEKAERHGMVGEVGASEVHVLSPNYPELNSDEHTSFEDEEDTNSSFDDGEKKKRKPKTKRKEQRGRKKEKRPKKKHNPVTQAIRIHKGSCQKISGLSTKRLQVIMDLIGPEAPIIHISQDEKPLNNGHALFPGEGAPMAEYVKAGKCIPRRGEIGLTIASFECSGYVMSGSWHRRMEAIPLCKENKISSVMRREPLYPLTKKSDRRGNNILPSL